MMVSIMKGQNGNLENPNMQDKRGTSDALKALHLAHTEEKMQSGQNETNIYIEHVRMNKVK